MPYMVMLDLFHKKYIYIYLCFWPDSLLHVVAKHTESGHIVAKENVSVQTESMKLSVDKHDVSVQFDYLIPLNGTIASSS